MKKLLVALLIAVPTLVAAIPSAALAATPHAAPLAAPATQGAPWIGLLVSPITEGVARRRGFPAQSGLLVRQVAGGSPAEKAGVLRRDILTAANEAPLRRRGDLAQAIKAAGVGGVVVLTVVRGETEVSLNVQVGERPADVSQAPRRPHTRGHALEQLGEVHATYKDEQGNLVSLTIQAGVVTRVAADTLSIQPNLGGLEQTVAVGADTQVVRGLRRIPLGEVQVGDLVLVMTRNGVLEHIYVVGAGKGLTGSLDDWLGPFFGGIGRRR